MNAPNKNELVKIGRWLLDGDTGNSSLALCSFYLTAGNGGECASRLPTPCDPSDFHRCIEFLEDCVDSKNRIELVNAIGDITKDWKKVRENWIPLISLYLEEKNQKTGPKLYALMKKIGL